MPTIGFFSIIYAEVPTKADPGRTTVLRNLYSGKPQFLNRIARWEAAQFAV